MTNVAEFYAAGIGFSIVSCDAHFGDDGELSHCRTIVNELYRRGGGEQVTWDNCELKWVILDPAPESEPLANPTDLADDNDRDRWMHIRDAFHAEALAQAQTMNTHDVLWDDDGDVTPQRGTMDYYALARTRRFERLRRYLEAAPAERISDAKRRIWKRYRDSIRLSVAKGYEREQWYMLALTKVQVNDLMVIAEMELLKRKLEALRRTMMGG